jgi:DNA topoisomerase IA
VNKLYTKRTNYTRHEQTTKNSILNNIRKLVKHADNIYIASDPDTDGGEAIAYHIKNHIKD